MSRFEVYADLDGRDIWLGALDAGERKLVSQLRRRARSNPDWNDFNNFWIKAVPAFYMTRGVPAREYVEGPAYRIAQDLSARLGIASGLVRASDYLDDLEEIIRTRFKTQRDFCKATGLSEDMLSHVLRGRKHLSLESLTAALGRIGYLLRIIPMPQEMLTARQKAGKPAKARKRA